MAKFRRLSEVDKALLADVRERAREEARNAARDARERQREEARTRGIGKVWNRCGKTNRIVTS